MTFFNSISVDNYGMVIFSFSVIFLGSSLLFSLKTKQRIAFIQSYSIPQPIIQKFHERYPELTSEQIETIVMGLKIYFQCYLEKNTFVSMPSRAVDMLWHEFILSTKEYHRFCQQAFGKFFHHTSEEMVALYSSKGNANFEMGNGMQTVWLFSCEYEQINSFNPNQLPLLFSIDTELAIEKGFKYELEKCAKYWGKVVK